MLTGAIRDPGALSEGDFRRHMPRMAGDNLDQNLGVVDKIAALAEARQCTPAQLALAWLVHHSPIVVPIPFVGGLIVGIAARDLDDLEGVFRHSCVRQPCARIR
jgi:hypothetical protein